MDRRNDLGGKLSYVVIAGILSIFFGFCWSNANAGLAKANQLSEKVAGQEECLRSMSLDLKDIKIMLQKHLGI